MKIVLFSTFLAKSSIVPSPRFRNDNPQLLFLLDHPLFRLVNTDRQVHGQTKMAASIQAETFWDLPPSALALQGFNIRLSGQESEGSPCHGSTLRFENSSSATIKWMQKCRVQVSSPPIHPHSHPHGPVVTRGDISLAFTSLDYQYC